jgi:hypothetical protein
MLYMKPLSRQEESRLIGSVEEAIGYTNNGMSPNEAIEKVARDRQYTPEYINRMVQAFNKSKSVFMLKKASADTRANAFDIADASVIIKNIYEPEMSKVANASPELPGSMLEVDFHSGNLADKLASLRDERAAARDIHPNSAYKRLHDHMHTCKGIQEQLYFKIQEHKYAMEKAFQKAAEYMAPMSSRELKKVAQHVINAYPSSGNRAMRCVGSIMHRPIPEMDKTANSAIFPNKEPYISITEAFNQAERMAEAEVHHADFEKKAESFLSSMSANAAANLLTGIGMDPKNLSDIVSAKKKPRPLEEELDPSHFNELKGIEARRQFTNLALEDPELKNYDYKDLVRAYNTSVQTVPDAYNNPVVLKNMMINNLQTSGIKDKFELQQEVKLQKDLSKERLEREKTLREEKARKREMEALERGPETTIDFGGEGLLGAIGEQVREGGRGITQALREGTREREEGQRRQADRATREQQDAARAQASADKDTQQRITKATADVMSRISGSAPTRGGGAISVPTARGARSIPYLQARNLVERYMTDQITGSRSITDATELQTLRNLGLIR